jgi:hypothetical protein
VKESASHDQNGHTPGIEREKQQVKPVLHPVELGRCPSVDTLSKLSTQGRWLDTWSAFGRSRDH